MVFSACTILKQFLHGHFSPWHLRPPPSPGCGHLSASSSVTSFRLSRLAVPPELFWTTWLLRATFFCGFPRLLPSPSSVAALMMLLTGREDKGSWLPDPAPSPSLQGTALFVAWGAASALSWGLKTPGAGEVLFRRAGHPQGHPLPHQGPSGGTQG